MNEEQQKVLEGILLDSIKQSLDKNNNSYISLIKVAKQHNIFFPELYSAFFVQALHSSFYVDHSHLHLIDNYQTLGVSIEETGIFYYDTWLYQAENFIQEQMKDQKYTKEECISMLIDKLQYVLKIGIPLPEEFNNSKYVQNIVGEENFKTFKRLNRNNIVKNLKNTFDDNSGNITTA